MGAAFGSHGNCSLLLGFRWSAASSQLPGAYVQQAVCTCGHLCQLALARQMKFSCDGGCGWESSGKPLRDSLQRFLQDLRIDAHVHLRCSAPSMKLGGKPDVLRGGRHSVSKIQRKNTRFWFQKLEEDEISLFRMDGWRLIHRQR